jgi:hypothetical protein
VSSISGRSAARSLPGKVRRLVDWNGGERGRI